MGKDILFPHGLSGVFISRGAVIGDRCTLFHQVTIGSNRLADTRSFGSPVIGNDVYIGAGAKIIGGVTVGNNVRIGANAVIVKDIPDSATVVTERVRVIPHDGARDNRFERYRK
jgi:serine O-acetyltransferase